jgi:hypothetical protein
MRARNVVIAVIACLCLLVPTIGSFYPVPPFPVNVFPYIFAAYMVAGGCWLFILSRRRRGLLTEIEADLDSSIDVHEQRAVPVPAGASAVAAASALEPGLASPDAIPSIT